MNRAQRAIALLVMLVGAPKAEAACTLSATAVAFGTYDVFQAGPDDSTGTITYRCGIGDRRFLAVQHRDFFGDDIKSDDFIVLGEQHGVGETDVAGSGDGNFHCSSTYSLRDSELYD